MGRRLAVAALLLVPLVPGAVEAQDAPVCIYNSQSFSEGAGLCVQRHLMMSCTVADKRAVWRLVEDRAVSRMCAGPTRLPAVEAAGPLRRQIARRLPPPGRSGDGKCFNFNGKRYCE